MCQSLSCVQLFVTPWTVARQPPLSMRFSRQEYQSGLPRPPSKDLPDPGIEPLSLMSPALAGRFSTTWETQEHHVGNSPIGLSHFCKYNFQCVHLILPDDSIPVLLSSSSILEHTCLRFGTYCFPYLENSFPRCSHNSCLNFIQVLFTCRFIKKISLMILHKLSLQLLHFFSLTMLCFSITYQP